MTPELTDRQLVELHKQLSELYRMYIDPASVDCIRLDDDVIAQLKTGASLVVTQNMTQHTFFFVIFIFYFLNKF